jgi:diguanylate cyclase (GGDEF)-like protein
MRLARASSRLRPWGFELRLGAALLGTLVAVFAVAQAVTADKLRESLVELAGAHYESDARSMQAAYAAADDGERPIGEALEVLETLSSRPGVVSARLVDAGHVVVGASDPDLVGERDATPAIDAALADGRAYAGREQLDAHRSGRGSEFEFVQPVRLGGKPFALEVDEDGAALQAQSGSVSTSLRWVFGVGLVVAFVLFYLFGGRALSRRHRSVLKRATLDPLTELGNHRAFQDELERTLSFAARQRGSCAVALIDLDDFKLANDAKGHRHGDEVLIAVARVLGSGRPEDRAFRIGGDEFAILFPGTDGAGAKVALERMLAAASEGARPTAFTAGVAALAPQAGDDATVVWEQADAALYEGKRSGGGRVVVFDDVAELPSVATPAKIRALRSLLEEPRLQVAFQPIILLREEGILGYEALARPGDEYGFDGPLDAFMVAEKVGRAHELDSICRSAALARARELPDGALLFLNVHPQTLDHDVLEGERLVRAVRAAGLEPGRVVLEVTEQAGARLPQVVAGAARLRALGFRIALDDVGAGNAGLETLRRLPVDYVKIDRSIVGAAVSDLNAHAVLVAIVAYARRTGAFVIAEGIESAELLEFVRHAHEIDELQDLSIEGGQGYLLGRPDVELLRGAAAAT